MNKVVTQIRDINKIEEELSSAYAGALAFNTHEEKVIQVCCTFLYHHKNIYAALQEDEEILENIVNDTDVSFTVIRSEKAKSPKSAEFKPVYKIVSVTLSGILKKPEEVKISDEIRDLYYIKYTGSKNSDEAQGILRLIMFDTSEIKAFEEAGG